MLKIMLLAVAFVSLPFSTYAAGDLQVYFIDTEGGQSTLFVGPSGQSLLVDTGWNERDADRITAAAKSAGLKQIDYLLVSHFHADHVGGVPALAARIPVVHVVEHGPSIEHGGHRTVSVPVEKVCSIRAGDECRALELHVTLEIDQPARTATRD